MLKIIYLILAFIPLYGISMQELIDLGLKQSTTVKQSRNQIEMAQVGYKESKAQQYGSLDLTGEFTHYNIPRTLAPLTPLAISSNTPITTTTDLFSGGIVYTIPIFTGFAQTQEIKIQELSQNIVQIKDKLTKEQLAYNIKILYLSILAQQDAVHAQHSYTTALKKLQDKVTNEVDLGKKAPIDLLKVKSDHTASETREALYKSMITITKATLASLVGIEKIQNISPIHIKVIKPRYRIETLLEDAETLAKVKIEDISIQKADKAIKKSASSKLPQINLTGYAGKNYGKDETLHQWDNETLWQIGVNVKWNLVDFGKSDLAEQKAKIAKMNAVFQKEQTLSDLKKTLIEGIESMKQNYHSYLGNEAQIKLLKKSEMIEKVKYENGASTMNDLLLAQGQTQLANAQLIQSKYEYQKNIYFIQYLMETGTVHE